MAADQSAERSRAAVLGLFPELRGAGGIQRGSRHIAAVLAEMAARSGWTCRFLSLNDPVGEHRDAVSGREFAYCGFARSKWRFAAAAAAGKARARLVLAAHPNLAPVGWAVKKRNGAPFTVVVWGVDAWEPLTALRRRALRAADLILAISRHTAGRVVQAQGVEESRVRLLPLALDPLLWERAQSGAATPPPPGFPRGRVLLSVTRLAAVDAYKGVDTVIQVLPRLAEKVPDVQYVVVGDGDDRGRHEELSRSAGVAARVHFLGRLEPLSAELAGCYANCDAFVLPSRGEGFGIAFLEAMAFGKPVVGGAHGGTPEVIEDGVSGFLVPHGEPEKLAVVLEPLLSNAGLRREMGERGRHTVETRFRFEQFAARLDAAIAGMLGCPLQPAAHKEA